MTKPVNILSTRILDAESISRLEAKGFSIIQYDFIGKEIKIPSNLEISNLDKDIVFTSKMGVKAFKLMHKIHPFDLKGFRFHSLDRGTKEKALENGFKISITGKNASELGDRIIANGDIRSVTHICGNIRRKELSEKLKSAGINLQEAVVYSTELTPTSINDPYDAIVFFSPSAVDSFLSKNKLSPVTIFCIGETTAAFARQKGYEEIQLSENPSENSVIESVLEYYSKK